MTEKKVTVVTELKKPQGAEEYARVGRKAQESMAPGKDTVKRFGEVEKAMAQVAKQAKALSDRKAADGLKAMAKEATFLAQEAAKASAAMEKLAHTRKLQGGVTGALVGGYLSGGMGGAGVGGWLGKQMGGYGGGVAGGVIGGIGARGVGIARAFGSTAFTGLQGMQQGMAGLPIVGGVMSGLLGSGMAAAQGALGVQAARHGMNPYLSMTSQPFDSGAMQAAGARARARVHIPAEWSVPNHVMSRAQDNDAAGVLAAYGGGTYGGRNSDLDAQTVIPSDDRAEMSRWSEQDRAATLSRKAAATARQRRAAAGKAAEEAYRAANDPFHFLRSTGVRYGMNETAALGAAGSYFGARGGMGSMDRFLGTAGGRAQYQQALEAQGRYGVGMEASGGLARGALNGAGGVSLEKTIKDGMKLGIDASESVSSMAARIRAFEETGIPVAAESLTALRAGLAQTMGGMRGVAVASQMMGAMQGVGRHGPQSSADWAMMTTMGGYQGGGIKEWMQARQRMEEGGGGASGLQKFIGKIANSGNPWANIMRVQDVFASKGISVSQSEARGMIGGDKAALARWAPMLADQAAQAAGVNLNGTAGQAGAGAQRQASLDNARNASGEKLLRVAQNLEEVSQKMLDNFSELAPAMTTFTSWAKEQPGKMKEYFTKVDGLLNMAHDIMAGK